MEKPTLVHFEKASFTLELKDSSVKEIISKGKTNEVKYIKKRTQETLTQVIAAADITISDILNTPKEDTTPLLNPYSPEKCECDCPLCSVLNKILSKQEVTTEEIKNAGGSMVILMSLNTVQFLGEVGEREVEYVTSYLAKKIEEEHINR